MFHDVLPFNPNKDFSYFNIPIKLFNEYKSANIYIYIIQSKVLHI